MTPPDRYAQNFGVSLSTPDRVLFHARLASCFQTTFPLQETKDAGSSILSSRAVISSSKCFLHVLRDSATADRERRFWQPSRHPESIETGRFWQQKLDYLQDNPCRKGFVRIPDHRRFSSAVWYSSDGIENVDVPITPSNGK
jgi:hypothetical protein